MSEENEPFMDAAKSGDVAVLQAQVDAGAKVTCRDEVNSTALHYACAGGHNAAVAFLLDKGADVNAVNDFNETPLHNASSKGHMEIVQLLLDKNANKDIQTDDGWTALHLAAEKGHPNVVKILVRRGANVSIKDKGGAAAAGYASHPEIIEEIATIAINTESGSQAAVDNANSLPPSEVFTTTQPVSELVEAESVSTIAVSALTEVTPPQVEKPVDVEQHDSDVLLETISLHDEPEGDEDRHSILEGSVKGAPSVTGTEASMQCCIVS